MAEGALTDRAHWSAYWASRRPERIPERWYYGDLLRRVSRGRRYSSLLELGGFPGSFAVYARRYLGFEHVALLDAFVDEAYLDRMLGVNGLTAGQVDVFEGDIFETQLSRQYDIVLSGGLVEHFEDPREALARHHRWVRPGGAVVVTVPNFRGLNGAVQSWFQPDNLALHNRELMLPETLASALRSAGDFVSVEAFYYGAFRAWLEPGAPALARIGLNVVRAAGVVLDTVRPRTRLTGRDVVAIGYRG